jgi:hypothetical protein
MLSPSNLMAKATAYYLQRYAQNVFRDGLKEVTPLFTTAIPLQLPSAGAVAAVEAVLDKAQRPLFVIGSQAVRAGV